MIHVPVLLKYWLPAILWMAVIFSASSDSGSGPRSSRYIEPVLRWFKPDLSRETADAIVAVVRKCAHVMEYGVLAVLLWWARRGTSRRAEAWNWWHAGFALVGAIVYAVTDELHQAFVPNRGPSLGDVLLDTLGAGLGLLVVWLVLKIRG